MFRRIHSESDTRKKYHVGIIKKHPENRHKRNSGCFAFIKCPAHCQSALADSQWLCVSSGSALQCQANKGDQRTAVRQSYGQPSQAAHVLSRLAFVGGQALAMQLATGLWLLPQAAPSQNGCGNCPALRTIAQAKQTPHIFFVILRKWF